MTNTDYVDQLSGSVLTLVQENPSRNDELRLQADEYFALVLHVANKSYLRNYAAYKNSFNYNTKYETYDFALYKQLPAGLFYITKSYDTVYNMAMPGRIVIVSANDLSKCLIL